MLGVIFIRFEVLILFMGSEILPVQRVFDLQRKYIENSIENVKKGLELHKKAMDTVDPRFPIEAYNEVLKHKKRY